MLDWATTRALRDADRERKREAWIRRGMHALAVVLVLAAIVVAAWGWI